MDLNNVWEKSKHIKIQKSDDITGNFSVWFDKNIPNSTKEELGSFMLWVEKHFNIPITLLAEFEYKHYLIRSDGKRVGYLFYWDDFDFSSVFDSNSELPMIRLPVRTERYTIEEILTSFIEAVTDYFAWISGTLTADYKADEALVDEILQLYLSSK